MSIEALGRRPPMASPEQDGGNASPLDAGGLSRFKTPPPFPLTECVELQIFLFFMTEGAQTSSGARSMSVWWSLAMRRRARQTTGGGGVDESVCVWGGVSGLGWASTVAEQQERRCHGDRQEEGEGARVHGEPCSGGGGGVG